jgi:hypothetical protein
MPDRTTAVVQRYLDALAGDTPADPLIRALLERAVGRLAWIIHTRAAQTHSRR